MCISFAQTDFLDFQMIGKISVNNKITDSV